MKLVCSINEGHIRKFAEFMNSNSKTVRRSRYLSLLAMFAVALVQLIAMISLGGSTTSIIGWILIAAIMILFVNWIHKRSVIKNTLRMYRENSGKGILGEVTYVLAEDCLTQITEFGSQSVKFIGIERIEALGGVAFVFTTPATAMPVPEDTTSSGNHEKFIGELQRLWIAASG